MVEEHDEVVERRCLDLLLDPRTIDQKRQHRRKRQEVKSLAVPTIRGGYSGEESL
jgi:hypothetical protein